MNEEDEKPREVKSIGDALGGYHIGADYALEERKPKRGIHSELHELIDKMRQDFGETAVKGVGSFSYYLGLLKKIPPSKLYQWLGDIKDSPKLDTPLARCKVFWWKYRHYIGTRNQQ